MDMGLEERGVRYVVMWIICVDLDMSVGECFEDFGGRNWKRSGDLSRVLRLA